jgi:hypothetical protein
MEQGCLVLWTTITTDLQATVKKNGHIILRKHMARSHRISSTWNNLDPKKQTIVTVNIKKRDVEQH